MNYEFLKQKNMKKVLVILIAMSLPLFFVSCTDGDSDTKNTELTEAEKEQIVASYDELKPLVDAVHSNNGTVEDYEHLIPTIKAKPMVEDAWVDESGLFVKFKKGGIIGWLIYDDSSDEEFIDAGSYSTKSKETANMPNGKKALLLNAEEESFNNTNKYFTSIEKKLQDKGYNVTTVNQSRATREFFTGHLHEYHVIFIVSHGTYSNNITWLKTGEEFKENFKDLTSNSEWKVNKLTIFNPPPSDKNYKKRYYSVSSKYLAESYKKKKFPNSLIYLTACEGLKNLDLAKNAFTMNGAGVVIGFKESQSVAGAAGSELFNKLLEGKTVYEALQYSKYTGKEYGLTFSGNCEMRLVESPSTPPFAASTQTWTFGTQTWSDAIHIPGCRKTDFELSYTEPNCRSFTAGTNTWYYYNWAYVTQNATQLCPDPWSVPDYWHIQQLYAFQYLDGLFVWEGAATGGVVTAKMISDFNIYGEYWTSTTYESYYLSHALRVRQYSDARGELVDPTHTNHDFGLQVRCVK
jgi:hypothetical protein